MAKTKKKINLAQLDQELNAGGLNGSFQDGEWDISAVSDKITEAQLEAAIAAHVAQEPPQPSVSEKLAAAGLTLDDLKNALGI